MRLVSGDEFSFGSTSKLIRADVAFSAEVLRIANSPLFGCRGKVDNVPHALTMLGMDRLKSLVVTVALRNFLSSTLQAPALRRCWRHSLACACTCEDLAAAAGMDKDAAYTAGLLHDIGRLGLLANYPAEYARLLDVAEEYGYDLLQCERDLFDVDHCQAGSWLVREWALPPEFDTITGKHHEEPANGRFDTATVVQYGCRISDAVGFGAVARAGTTFDEIVAQLPRSVGEKLGSEDEFVMRIGGMAAVLERDMLI